MFTEEHMCPKCSAVMDEGFLIDDAQTINQQQAWHEGKPEQVPLFGFLKYDATKVWKVKTFRCTGCGYLESYAPRRW